MNFADKICIIIENTVKNAKTITQYRKPLVGFASAKDPFFNKMKKIIGTHIVHPQELLPEAETVAVFFIPFAENVIRANRKGDLPAKEWVLALVETNQLIETIYEELTKMLAADGIKTVSAKVTYNFNEKDFTADWSHKSVAYVAGLGTFGVNHQLITQAGSAGRLGSMVISAKIPPTPRPSQEFCRYYREGKCLFCVNKCPAGALKVQGLDKKRCYQHLQQIAKYRDLCDACGKCASGPCALGSY